MAGAGTELGSGAWWGIYLHKRGGEPEFAQGEVLEFTGIWAPPLVSLKSVFCPSHCPDSVLSGATWEPEVKSSRLVVAPCSRQLLRWLPDIQPLVYYLPLSVSPSALLFMKRIG